MFPISSKQVTFSCFSAFEMASSAVRDASWITGRYTGTGAEADEESGADGVITVFSDSHRKGEYAGTEDSWWRSLLR